MKQEIQKIEISTKIVWQTILILLGFWFIYFIRDILILLFLAIIIVSAAQPVVNAMEAKKIPRIAAVLLIYASFILLFGAIVSLVIPVLSNELGLLGNFIPGYVEGFNSFMQNISEFASNYHFEENIAKITQNVSDYFTNLAPNVFSNTLGFLVSIFKALVVFSLSFYMLIKKDGTRAFLTAILPNRGKRKRVIELVERIQMKMGRWLVGEFSLMFVIFILEFIVLSILGVPMALVLALLGGLLEIVPYIGPTAALIPAVLIAFTVSPWTAVFVIIAYIAIQQMENHIIVPLVMKKAVGLNPVVIILSLLIGGKLAGVFGVILAVPFATAMGVIIEDLLNNKEKEEHK